MYKLHQAKKKTDYPTTRLLPLNGTIHVRLRKMHTRLYVLKICLRKQKSSKKYPKKLDFRISYLYICSVVHDRKEIE